MSIYREPVVSEVKVRLPCDDCAFKKLAAATLGPVVSGELPHVVLCENCALTDGWRQETPRLQARAILGSALGWLSNLKDGTSPYGRGRPGIQRDLAAIELLLDNWIEDPKPYAGVCEVCALRYKRGLRNGCDNCNYRNEISVGAAYGRAKALLGTHKYAINGVTIGRDLAALEYICENYLKKEW